ncbi:Protein of unknown function [Pyronema omphalodes CBS 100304]|uniref:Uncharacterized protein n=1 Tax=Pyronema omphalodes (strain CBS 100304) TaxID=1076935 RepID=U4KUA3_PYROM|nr:Protein of unknown function [Pyronema omphalodes CBS 100304]
MDHHSYLPRHSPPPFLLRACLASLYVRHEQRFRRLEAPAKFIAGLMAACSLVGSGICPPNLDLPNVQQAWRPLINSFFKHTIV